MGTSPRGFKHKSDTPGPGAYESKLYTVNSPKLLKNGASHVFETEE